MRELITRRSVQRLVWVAVLIGAAFGGWQWVQRGVVEAVPDIPLAQGPNLTSIRPQLGPSGLVCRDGQDLMPVTTREGTILQIGRVQGARLLAEPSPDIFCTQFPPQGLVTSTLHYHGPTLADFALAAGTAAGALVILLTITGLTRRRRKVPQL